MHTRFVRYVYILKKTTSPLLCWKVIRQKFNLLLDFVVFIYPDILKIKFENIFLWTPIYGVVIIYLLIQ